MYIILVNDDNTLMTSVKERIMQRSKLVDELCFLAKPMYKGYDMSQFTVMLEYLAPVSKKYRTEILTLSEDSYKEHLMYTLPFDTNLTAEAGKVEVQLTFVMADLDANGKSIQRVRKTSKTYIEIFPITAWSDIIPDEALTAIDQRILMVDAQLKALVEAENAMFDSKADNISYDEADNSLQLKSGDNYIGDKVKLKDCAMSDEGVPIIDFGSGNTPVAPDVEEDEEDDNVVEF
jgi:hypothetical protein